VEFLGRKFLIPPTVHPINPMSDLLGNAVLQQVRESDRVLDMGTGCGVNAILAASKSNEVVAVDINPGAVKIAQQNAKANAVEQKIDFRISDVFSTIEGKFDLIIFDPPFRWLKPRDEYEISTTDENYKTLRTFFTEAADHLSSNGRMLICFGSSGDIDYLYQLMEKDDFKYEVIAHRDLQKEGMKLDYFTFLVKK
jgi:release factor glutamine methyltransferase